MDIFLGRSFYILVSNISDREFRVEKHVEISQTAKLFNGDRQGNNQSQPQNCEQCECETIIRRTSCTLQDVGIIKNTNLEKYCGLQ